MATAKVVEAAKLLKFYASFSDVDGQIRAATDLAAATRMLLGAEVLLSAKVVENLVVLLRCQRTDAQAAAAACFSAACRFDEIQSECVAQDAVIPLTSVLSNGLPEAQLEACRAVEAIAHHRDGREALAQAGAVRALLRIARDELHIAQERAATALAKAVGIEGVTPRRSTASFAHKADPRSHRGAAARAAAQKSTKADGKARAAASASSCAATSSSADAPASRPAGMPSHSQPQRSTQAHSSPEGGLPAAVEAAGNEAIESFVLMAQRGGGVPREQAAYGLLQLCRNSGTRRRLVTAGAVEALLCCADHWRVEVPRAAVAALAALTEEATAATRLPTVTLPPSHLPGIGAAAVGGMSDLGINSGGVAGVSILHWLSHSADGATRLAAQRTYAHLCAQPVNAPLLMRAGTLGQMCELLAEDAAAESQQAAVRAIGHLCAHAHISVATLEDLRLLPLLLACARGKRRLGRGPALELKTLALTALAQLAGRSALHDALIDGGLPPTLVGIAHGTPHVAPLRSLLLALLRILRMPHSASRVQLLHTPSAVATLREIFRAKSFDEDVRASAALALCFIAADAQCHLPAGQPPQRDWAALVQAEIHHAATAVAGATKVGHGASVVTAPLVGASSTATPGARAPLRETQPKGAAVGRDGSSGRPAAISSPADALAADLVLGDGDFFAGVLLAFANEALRALALQALALLALRWEFHAAVFDHPVLVVTSHVVRIARGNFSQGAEGSGRDPAADGPLGSSTVAGAASTQADTTAQRLAASVLSNLNAARELRLSARHALPLPKGSMVAADATDLASLASALSAASVDVVRVSVSALASLSSAHPGNRDKIAARHCISSLLSLAQSDIVAVQRDALGTLAAMALQPATKEEFIAEGALPLLLNLMESTLSVPPSSPRLRALQFSRLLSTRRLTACALANLSENHLRVQAAIIEHGSALRQLIAPLQRHNAALAAAEARAAAGPPRTAQQQAEVAVAEASEAGARLDRRSRTHLLRCLANLCLNDATQAPILDSALLPELPACARRGSSAERRFCALAIANLAPNHDAHPILINDALLLLLLSLLEPPGAQQLGRTSAGEHAGEHAVDASGADGALDRDGVADETESGEDTSGGRWAEEEAAAAWEPGGVVGEGESALKPARLLVLQSIAELSASEETHANLVKAGFVGALLPLAAPQKAALARTTEAADRDQSAQGAAMALEDGAPEHLSESRGSGTMMNAVRRMWPFGALVTPDAATGGNGDVRGPTRSVRGAAPSEEERMEAIVALANLAENPETHDAAFSGLQGSKAFELFVALIKAPTPAEQREGFRALSCLALARSRAAATTGGGAIDSSLMALLLQKATQALQHQPDGRESDEEVAFHAARALSLLSTNQANRRLIVEHGGLPIMYSLARQPDTDIQAEAATVIANVTAASYEAQMRVCADGVVQLLVYLCASQHEDVRAAAARAIANLTQNIDNEPALREARCADALFAIAKLDSASPDVKWQSKRALANLEAARLLVGLRKYGGAQVILAEPGVVEDICKHADAANVGAQREVGRALANLAASEVNHAQLLSEGGLTLCMDLVVSNSAEVQQQATRAIGNLALSPDESIADHMVGEGVLELLVLLAASWDEGVQEEAAVALASFAARPRHRTAVIRAGALAPLLEQLKSTSAAVNYHGAMALLTLQ